MALFSSSLIGQIATGTAIPSQVLDLGNGIYLYSDTGNKIFRSIDYGVNWIEVKDTSSEANEYGSPVINDMVNLGSGTVLAVARTVSWGFRYIYKSVNYGENWSILSYDTSANHGHFNFSLNTNTNVLYMFVTDFRYIRTYSSDNQGTSWTLLDSETYQITLDYILTYDIKLLYIKDDIFIMANGAHLFYTSDAGVNWIRRQSCTKTTSIYYKDNICYAGNEKIWISTDYGYNWTTKYTYTSNCVLNFNSYVYLGFTVIVGFDNHGNIIYSFNNGDTWTRISSDFTATDTPLFSFTQEENILFSSNNTGKFYGITINISENSNYYNIITRLNSIINTRYNINIRLNSGTTNVKYFNTLVSLKSGTMHIYSFNSIIKVKNNYTYIPVSANIKETYYIPVKGQILPETNFNSLPFEV